MIDLSSRDVKFGMIGVAVGGIVSWIMKNPLKRAYSGIKFLSKHKKIEQVKMVIVARSDLRISSGKLAAQCAHAAVSSYAASKEYNPHVTNVWESTGQAKIVVRTDGDGEMELYNLAEKAKRLNIITALIRDAGHTQLLSGTPTALGMGPALASDLDKVSGKLRLY